MEVSAIFEVQVSKKSDGDVPQTETLKLEIRVISNIKNEGKTHSIPVTYHTFVMYHKGGKVLTCLDVPLRAYNAQVENITALVFLMEIRLDTSGGAEVLHCSTNRERTIWDE